MDTKVPFRVVMNRIGIAQDRVPWRQISWPPEKLVNSSR